jgi:hypothetical protein
MELAVVLTQISSKYQYSFSLLNLYKFVKISSERWKSMFETAGGRIRRRFRTTFPTNGYVELRNGGYHVIRTRAGLDVVAHDFRRARSAEAIIEPYPSIGLLAKVVRRYYFHFGISGGCGGIPQSQERVFEEINAQHNTGRFDRAF